MIGVVGLKCVKKSEEKHHYPSKKPEYFNYVFLYIKNKIKIFNYIFFGNK